jgi:hypothetical protein
MILQYSCLLFCIPALYAWSKDILGYSNAFIFLTITSYIWHRRTNDEKNKNPKFWWVDQFAVYHIVLVGLFYYMENYNTMITIYKILIPLCCLGCLILYIYNDNIINDDRIHMVIHILTFIGHTMIIKCI